jgi:hypothetical protein
VIPAIHHDSAEAGVSVETPVIRRRCGDRAMDAADPIRARDADEPGYSERFLATRGFGKRRKLTCVERTSSARSER